MASTGNFGTWNPLADYSSGTTFDDGNCTTAISQQNSYRACLGPTIPDSGKWYIEFFIDYQTAGFPSDIGVLDGRINTTLNSASILSNAGSFHIEPMTGLLFSESSTGTSYTGNSGSPAAVGNADAKVGIAFDRDNNKLWFAVNNTWINVGSGLGDPANDSNPAVSSIEQNLSISHGIRQATGTSKVVINCGQDSTFGGLATAQGNTDGNGFGDFFYEPPSGFLALCSANLPISSDIDPAETDDDIPSKHFGVVTFTGNGTARTISGLGFQPDMIWGKRRDGTRRHYLVDSSRGFTKYLHPEGTYTEGTSSDGVTSATTDGFAIGGSLDYINANTQTYVAWCWRANGGTTATNTDGALTSTVQANQALGFSISQYTSNGTGQSFGHGLGAAPDFFMIKKRLDQDRNWMGWHTGLTTASTGYIRWNLTNAEGNDTLWNNTAPSATVINVQKDTTEVNNPSGAQYICYAWRSIEGYSKFGKFEGNSDADGPFVYLGFRPRLVFFKNIDATENWQIRDTARHSNTGSQTRLYWNSDAAEGTASTASPIDFLANGFKIRGSNSEINTNTIIYGAWGDVPSKYNNTF